MARKSLDTRLELIPRQLQWWSIPFIKVSMFFFGLLLLYFIPGFTVVEWGIWLIATILLAIVPVVETQKTIGEFFSGKGKTRKKLKKQVRTLSGKGLLFLMFSVITFSFMVSTAFPTLLRVDVLIPFMMFVCFAIPPLLDYWNQV